MAVSMSLLGAGSLAEQCLLKEPSIQAEVISRCILRPDNRAVLLRFSSSRNTRKLAVMKS